MNSKPVELRGKISIELFLWGWDKIYLVLITAPLNLTRVIDAASSYLSCVHLSEEQYTHLKC